jgi:type I restriction enzyme S subunit
MRTFFLPGDAILTDCKTINVPNLRFGEFEGEWEKKTLGDFGTTIIGLTYSPKDVVAENGIIVLRSSNIKNGVTDYTDIVRVNKTIKDKLITQENDLLICARNGSSRLIGKNALLKNADSNLTFGAFMMIYRSDDNRFIHQLLATQKYTSQILENLGARINQITTSNFNSFSFFFPYSKEEQGKIANFLTLLDDRISTQIQIIEELKSLKNVTSRKLIYYNKLLDKKIKLSDIGEVKNGYAFVSTSYREEGKYKVITIANVTGERNINTSKCNNITDLPKDIQSHQTLKLNDILISQTGNVGRVSLCNIDNALLNQRVGLFIPNNPMCVEYVFQAISNQKFEKTMIAGGQGAAQMNISKSDIENYEIPYSSNEKLLLSISALLKKNDEKIDLEVKQYNLLVKQKKYLLSQMFI